MPFPFFRLPSELRNRVYSHLFESKHEQNLITPDATRCRQRNGINSHLADMVGNLAFLRTSQQAHEEGTSILYGNNIFYFTDQAYGFEEHEIAGFDTKLKSCDFVYLYSFITRIGVRNRSRLRHIRFSFSSLTYILYPHESKWGGGHLIGEALDLLSYRHNLQTLDVEFTEDDRFSMEDCVEKENHCHGEFLVLFHWQPCLADKLWSIRGIKELRILMPAIKDFAAFSKESRRCSREACDAEFHLDWPAFWEMKKEMENDDWKPPKRLNPSTFLGCLSDDQDFQMDAVDQCRRQVDMQRQGQH